MKEFEFTGGSRIGLMNSTIPFATLTIKEDMIIIDGLKFRPEEVISIEPYSELISSGIRINHIKPNYESKVVFWSLKSPRHLIAKIREVGFLEKICAKPDEELRKKLSDKAEKEKFPLNIAYLGIVIPIFVVLFFGSVIFSSIKNINPAYGLMVPVGFMTTNIIGLISSRKVRNFALRKDIKLEDINAILYLLIFACIFALIILGLLANYTFNK